MNTVKTTVKTLMEQFESAVIEHKSKISFLEEEIKSLKKIVAKEEYEQTELELGV